MAKPADDAEADPLAAQDSILAAWTTDPRRHIEAWTEEAEVLTGYPSSEAVGPDTSLRNGYAVLDSQRRFDRVVPAARVSSSTDAP